jgi:hypothetical protein
MEWLWRQHFRQSWYWRQSLITFSTDIITTTTTAAGAIQIQGLGLGRIFPRATILKKPASRAVAMDAVEATITIMTGMIDMIEDEWFELT